MGVFCLSSTNRDVIRGECQSDNIYILCERNYGHNNSTAEV